MLDNYRHIHFIGIGGSGLSALVRLALAQGLETSGSDIVDSALTQSLKREGAKVFVGHQADNVSSSVELVVYSEAIDKTVNPEYLAAVERRLPLMSYFEALGEISHGKKTIVVTGTHGKTTTTAMLGQVLANAGKATLVIVGSQAPAFGGRNIFMAPVEGGYFVVEACEYRRSFLSFAPFGMVLLNCEAEHLDYYKDEKDYMSAFTDLVRKIPKDGFLVYNRDDQNAVQVAEACEGKKIPVGMVDAQKLTLRLKIPGRFNELNAAHALAAAKEVGVMEPHIKESLENFRGTSRRMEIKGEENEVLIMDDYGHHPTEVKATLGALREKYPERRLICVFQPHQYSRTHQLLHEFSSAFTDAHLVIIPNIYEARDSEKDKAAVSAESFVETLQRAGINAVWGRDFEETLALLKKEVKSGDLVLTMGAGDVVKLADRFLKKS